MQRISPSPAITHGQPINLSIDPWFDGPYVDGHQHEGQGGSTATMRIIGRKYLFVYPFVKIHDWYQLPKEDRQRMMTEHFAIGHRYPGVKISTAYSFGLDDQEFVLGFETDDAAGFLDLVEELRGGRRPAPTPAGHPHLYLRQQAPEGLPGRPGLGGR